MLDTLDVARDDVEYLSNVEYDQPWTSATPEAKPFRDWEALKAAMAARGTMAAPLTFASKNIGKCLGKIFPSTSGHFADVSIKVHAYAGE